MFHYHFSKLLDFVFSDKCLDCRAKGSLLCNIHIGRLKKHSPRCYICHEDSREYMVHEICKQQMESNISNAYYIFEYCNRIKKILYMYKYGNSSYLANFFTELIINEIDLSKVTHITYIPSRLSIERPYNQSKLIAKLISSNYSIPLIQHHRRLNTSRSTSKSLLERQLEDNKYKQISNISNDVREILIIDDVLTTGTTLETIAKDYSKNMTIVKTLCITRNKMSYRN